MTPPSTLTPRGADIAARLWDAVVVGAGPAGALAAHGLAHAGARVLLVDRARFPRGKVCGCCLNGRALDALEHAGLTGLLASLGPRPYTSVRLSAPGAAATLSLPPGVSVSRAQLDAALVEAAMSVGAWFVDRTHARGLHTERPGAPHTLSLQRRDNGRQTNVRCQTVIIADGLDGAFARSVLGGAPSARASRIGAGAMLDADASVPWHDHAVNMTIGRAGYVGAVRLEDGRWNVAAALDPMAVRAARGVAPVVGRGLRDAGVRSPRALDLAAWRGTVQLSRRPARVAATRLFAIGDAAGYVEPFTGDGMACAFDSARAVLPLVLRAAEHWEPDLVPEWSRVYVARLSWRHQLASAAAWMLRRPALASALMTLLGSHPALAAPAVAWMSQRSPSG